MTRKATGRRVRGSNTGRTTAGTLTFSKACYRAADSIMHPFRILPVSKPPPAPAPNFSETLRDAKPRRLVRAVLISVVALMVICLFWQLHREHEQLVHLHRHIAKQEVSDQARRFENVLRGNAASARQVLQQFGSAPESPQAATTVLAALKAAVPLANGVSWLDTNGEAEGIAGETLTRPELDALFLRLDRESDFFYTVLGPSNRLALVMRHADGTRYWAIDIAPQALDRWLAESGKVDSHWALVTRDNTQLRASRIGSGDLSNEPPIGEYPVVNTDWNLTASDIPDTRLGWFDQLVTKTLLYLLCASLTVVALISLLRELRALRALNNASTRSLHRAAGALSAIEDPVLVTRADGELEYLNRSAMQIFGLSELHAPSVNLLELLPTLVQTLAAPSAQLQRTCVTLSIDQVSRQFSVDRSLLREDDVSAGYVWVLRDETERLSALATLEETHRRYRDIFEGSGVGLCVMDLSALEQLVRAHGFESEQAFEAWLQRSPRAVGEIQRVLAITEVNAMALRLLGATSTEHSQRVLIEHFEGMKKAYLALVAAMIAGNRYVEAEVHLPGHPEDRHFWITARMPENRTDYRAVTISLNDVTSRKRVELSLIERERFWSEVVHALPDTVYVLDIATQRRIFSNDSLWRQLGYVDTNPSGSPDDSWDRLIHPEDVSKIDVLRQQQRTLEPNQLLQCEIRVRHFNGSWRWFDIREQAFEQDEPGHVARLIGIAKDITQRIEASESLRTNERRYRLLTESISDVIFGSDASMRMNYISASVQQTLGYAPEELLELGVQSIIANPQQMLGLTTLMKRVQEGLGDPHKLASLRCDTEAQHMVIDCLRADGKKIPVEIRVVLMWDDLGQFQGLLGVGRDISRQRRAEKDMRMAAIVFEHSTAAILVTDPVGYIVQVNHAFSRITGYRSEEILDQTPALLTADKQQANQLQYIMSQLAVTGSWEGEVWLKRRNNETYPAWVGITAVHDEDGDLVSYVCFFSDIGERKASEQRIHRLAYYDALTQLPNRTLFQDRLHTALRNATRSQAWVVLMFLDLDRFKPINDSLGHAAGDRMLKDVAQRLSACVDQEDTVARMGGDEFTLLLRASEARENALTRAIHVAERILGSLSRPFILEGREFFVTASIGIALSPQDGNELSQLMKNADTAMYHAKEMGKNNFQFYQADMNARALERLELESDLRHALDNQQFQLYYQPQFSGDGRRLTGVEALLRWQHPQRGFVSPADFVPVLEELGLVVQVGDWALAEACQQLKKWHIAKVRVPKISVNLSARQFGDGQLRARIARILSNSGLPPSCLELELTESILMRDVGQTMELLDGLKQLGVYIAVDDFGTGYSSLNYLKQFPIDVLKIDRSFVDGLPDGEQDAQIARAIIAMAHSLNLAVIAEGVETQAQLDFLREHGCDEVQGFLLGKPMPALEFEMLYSSVTPVLSS
jgi:diguanylate cyclase (GGDEF)-like protein/PAS domain S-box-containing protein